MSLPEWWIGSCFTQYQQYFSQLSAVCRVDSVLWWFVGVSCSPELRPSYTTTLVTLAIGEWVLITQTTTYIYKSLQQLKSTYILKVSCTCMLALVFHILYLQHWPWLIKEENLVWYWIFCCSQDFLVILVDQVIYSFLRPVE